MLVGTHALSVGSDGRRRTKNTRAGCCEENVFGSETQVVVFKLGRPVIEEGIFQTKTDQQTIQRGAGLRGGSNEGAVYIIRDPVKSSGLPSRLALNTRSLQSDACSPRH